MKKHFSIFSIFVFSLFALAFTSCDDTTEGVGFTMTDQSDVLTVSTDTFNVLSQSVKAGAVVSRSTIAYLGKIRDPETGAYITSNSMIQYASVEGYTPFPDASLIEHQEGGKPIADSCEIRLFYNNTYGDKLAPIKIKAMEMSKPMEETGHIYTDFDPEAEGYIREGGIAQERTFTLDNKNLTEADLEDSDDIPFLRIKLEGPYTDANGVTYNNFGTYLMHTFYAHPEYFNNNYAFTHHVLPGFYFKTMSGLGAMAYVHLSQIRVYYKQVEEEDERLASFGSTEEVLQTTYIENDDATLDQLVGQTSCTYIKSPAGIFTQLTLPVNEMLVGHENDTINSARIIVPRESNSQQSDYHLSIPTSLLLIPATEYESFFENKCLPDNKTTFLASYNATSSSYTFSNISSLIAAMRKSSHSDARWNKVLLIPVTLKTVTTTVSGSSTQRVIAVSHDMTPTSTRLKGGLAAGDNGIKISVIYSKLQ